LTRRSAAVSIASFLSFHPQMKIEFLQPKFDGARFNEHTLPLDVTRDLAAYEELVTELAKRLFLIEHPERQRVPKGFGADFQLHLERVDEGSARPLLSLVTAGMLALSGGDQSYFERARDLVAECIRAPGDQLPDDFPKDLLSLFNRFGRSLREDESLDMGAGGKAAVLTPAKRKALVLAADQVYERDIELSGMIEEADFKAMTFRMRLLDGTKATIPIPDHFAEKARQLNGRPRHLVTMRGVGNYDSWDKLQKIVEVETLSTQMNHEIANRLEEISSLQDGWLDGAGLAPDGASLKRVAPALIAYYPENLVLPAIIPTPEGNLLLEWQSSGDPTVDLKLDGPLAEFHAFDPEGNDVERDFTLGSDAEWKTFFDFLSRSITPHPA